MGTHMEQETREKELEVEPLMNPDLHEWISPIRNPRKFVKSVNIRVLMYGMGVGLTPSATRCARFALIASPIIDGGGWEGVKKTTAPLRRLELRSSAPEADTLSTELQGRA